MSVKIVCGLTGAGKTYFVVRRIIEEFKKLPPDFKLVANTHITLPKEMNREFIFMHDIKELLDVERSIVVLDDAGSSRWLSARGWDKMDPRIQDKMINNRKDGLRVWVTTQFMDGVDKYVRLNAHEYWEAEKIAGSDEFAQKPWGICRYRRYHPRAHSLIRRERLDSKYYLLRKKYIDMFDTYEKVGEAPRAHTGASKAPVVRTLSQPSDSPFSPRVERKMITRADVRNQQSDLEKVKVLFAKRQRGRPRKIKILTA